MPEFAEKVKLLELAMAQARSEGTHGDRAAVAEIALFFYNRLNDLPRPIEQRAQRDKQR